MNYIIAKDETAGVFCIQTEIGMNVAACPTLEVAESVAIGLALYDTMTNVYRTLKERVEDEERADRLERTTYR